MITKKTTAILITDNVMGTRVEYRIFGILLYRKELIPPAFKDRHDFEWFQGA